MALTLNVGGMDRWIRLVVGLLLLLVGFLVDLGTAWMVVIFGVAAILLVTGLVQYCPLNRLFGINTRRRTAA